MLLSEILDQVDTIVHNSASVTIKIQWINQIQNQMYRDFPVPESVAVFNTLKDQAAYTLPPDCTEDRIRALLIDGHEYPFIPAADAGTGDMKFWTTVVTGDILLNPTPDKVYDGVLYYRPRPRQLTEADMGVKPAFPEDFHEMLVLGCASRVAKLDPTTIALANVFENDFKALAQQAIYTIMIGRRAPRVAVRRAWM